MWGAVAGEHHPSCVYLRTKLARATHDKGSVAEMVPGLAGVENSQDCTVFVPRISAVEGIFCCSSNGMMITDTVGSIPGLHCAGKQPLQGSLHSQTAITVAAVMHRLIGIAVWSHRSDRTVAATTQTRHIGDASSGCPPEIPAELENACPSRCTNCPANFPLRRWRVDDFPRECS
ncbi:hypothetical protein CCHOA_07695 [Corynebacterium choanae]|uniref:Uncharacterized protein n=1 Tax=Corynebacterium choanae TaxID=1862358 RepID=A0A3G6J744_9CORY|nr:hypothetical protein CCHOA_07695 [Corynebacterium choanae]